MNSQVFIGKENCGLDEKCYFWDGGGFKGKESV
jgi:hypothetical protein